MERLANIRVGRSVRKEGTRVTKVVSVRSVNSLGRLHRRITSDLNLSLRSCLGTTRPVRTVCVVTSRAHYLTFVVTSNVVPSGMGRNCLTELILEEAVEFVGSLGVGRSLTSMVTVRLSFLSGFCPRVHRDRRRVVGVVALRRRECTTAIGGNGDVIGESVGELGGRNGGRVPLSVLVSLCSTRNVPPRAIIRVTKSSFAISIPNGFFARITKTRRGSASGGGSAFGISFPRARLLFCGSFCRRRFRTRILNMIRGSKGRYLVFSGAAFCPRKKNRPSSINRVSVSKGIFGMRCTRGISGMILRRMSRIPRSVIKGAIANGVS